MAIVMSEYQRRMPITLPGRLVYTAQIDQSKLECFYCICCCTICNKASAARRSFFDVYTNGVMTNTPHVSGCCMQMDNVHFMFFDDPRLGGSNGKAGCCTPFPCPCPNMCDCCGEVYYFYRCCGCGIPACFPLGLGHAWSLAFFGCFSCCITDLFCGLAPGEAERLERAIQMTRAGNFVLIDYPPLNFMPMGQPMMGQPAAVPGQPVEAAPSQPAKV